MSSVGHNGQVWVTHDDDRGLIEYRRGDLQVVKMRVGEREGGEECTVDMAAGFDDVCLGRAQTRHQLPAEHSSTRHLEHIHHPVSICRNTNQ